ncbi:hypothetical protein G7Z17_g9230 [Cylindrodendrum hubeiense]|uniref:Aminoglycoside phosphotransferase domain-containing protein n=1 Tax=Cylindrodendrum hubeiense TaxID=595255 RepID=A0A9P5H8A4_9HYPO|nr:hypothetical protein G7Z17_g9230 [Cylindrodendrum hubeiense]
MSDPPIVPEHALLVSSMEMVQEIDDNSWLLDGKLIISRQDTRSSDCPCWETGEGDFFTLSPAPSPEPKTRLVAFGTIDPLFELTSWNGRVATWHIGNASMKIDTRLPSWYSREHRMLEYIQSKGDLGFRTRPILYEAEIDGQFYLLRGNLPGTCLGHIWHTLQPDEKKYYVDQTANMVQKLAEFQSDTLCAPDGGMVREMLFKPEYYHTPPTHDELVLVAEALKMDCSTFHLSLNDLSPGNIFVNGTDEPIGVHTWYLSAFLPKAWTRTKLCMSDYAHVDCDPKEMKESENLFNRIVDAEEAEEPTSPFQPITNIAEMVQEGGQAMALLFDRVDQNWKETEDRRVLFQKLVETLKGRQEWRFLLQKRLGEKGFPENSANYERNFPEAVHSQQNFVPLMESLPRPFTFVRDGEDFSFTVLSRDDYQSVELAGSEVPLPPSPSPSDDSQGYWE